MICELINITYIVSVSSTRQTIPEKSKDGGSDSDISTSAERITSSPGLTNHAILFEPIEALLLAMLKHKIQINYNLTIFYILLSKHLIKIFLFNRYIFESYYMDIKHFYN